MASSRPQRLRVGVIGLGRLWEARHKPAFQRLSDRFRVVSVYDQVYRRAELEAESIGATASESLSQLVERHDVDVVSILTPQWFGLQAIEIACRAGKPIYCALPLAAEPEHLERLDHLFRSNGVAFMPELARRHYPATVRLKTLLSTCLGPARLILGHTRLFAFDRYSQPGPTTQLAPAPLLIDPGSNLVDWCRFLFEDEPISVQASGTTVLAESNTGHDFEEITAVFSQGRMAQVSVANYHSKIWGDATRFLPRPGFQIFAERGSAWLEMPDKIHWTDSSGTYEQQLPMEPSLGENLNLDLLRMVREEESAGPTWNDAWRVARLVGDLKLSESEGRTVLNTVDL